MIYDDFIKELKTKRKNYAVSQMKLATDLGISRQYINEIENGKVIPKDELKEKILYELEKLNPNAPLFLLIDYFRVRFSTTDVKEIIEKVLRIKFNYLNYEEYGFYSYENHYAIGNIFIMVSKDISKGVLVELKGQGCRQMESYLIAQGRSWYDFMLDCLIAGGIMKRIDLAINDRVGILNIPELTQKCRNEECISYFRSFKSYRTGELKMRKDKEFMGNTLYIGSLKSELYFCIYEKDYEQYFKNGISIEDSEIKNRFEIRLKNERAYHAVVDLITYRDAEHTAFSIINHYVRFVDKNTTISKSKWKINNRWAWFIGENRKPLKLTSQPEPYTIQKTLSWLSKQVAPTLKMIIEYDNQNNTTIFKDMINNTRLNNKQKQFLERQNIDIKEIISIDTINKEINNL